MSQTIISMAIKVRNMVLHQADSISEELYDIQPANSPHLFKQMGAALC